MNQTFIDILRDLQETGEASLTRTVEGRTYVRQFARSPRLILLGAGHVSQALAACASKVEFAVTVLDDRPFFACRGNFPDAEEILCGDFETVIREQLHVSPKDYVCILTRGHRWDGICLRTLLQGEMPCYLGMMGSRRRVTGLLAQLEQEGFDPEKLQKVYTPIGIPIGSVSPAEIAVSITAQLILVRGNQPKAPNALPRTEVQEDVLEFAARDPAPKAMLLVLETKGSTPAKAGALMAVDKAGNTRGTVGGGCAEGEALLAARRLIGTGSAEVLDVNLTADMEDEEGMVCGGTMRLLLEDLPQTE